jgi:hypothetical protein
MTSHRLINWLAALAVVALFAAVQHQDALDAIRDKQAQVASTVEAQRTQDRLLRRDLAAAALCREQHGEAGYQWNAADQLVCVPRKGKRQIQTAWVAP